MRTSLITSSALMTLIILVAGCGKNDSPPSADAQNSPNPPQSGEANQVKPLSSVESELVGTWVTTTSQGLIDHMTFAADRTFSDEVTGFTSFSSTGTWRIDNKDLVMIFKTSTAAMIGIGHEQRGQIVDLDNATLVTEGAMPGGGQLKTTY